jgi:imidazolonepropionase-like amidohydrolase
MINPLLAFDLLPNCGEPNPEIEIMSSLSVSVKGKASSVLIRDITVVHPEREEGDQILEGASVVIGDGRIVSVGKEPKLATHRGWQVLDGGGKFLLPGFIDTHVHFFQSANPYTRPDGLDLRKRVPYEGENARNHARLPVTFRTWLACGVTSVMDVGGPMWNFEVRARAMKSPDAPRVQATGPLFSMVADQALELDDPPIVKVTSPEDIRRLAAKQLRRRPDYLKVWYIHAPGDDLGRQEQLVRRVGGYARRAKIPLAVHATELETAKSAIRAGADILVHSVMGQPLDEEFLASAKRKRVVYIPTLYVERGYYEVYSRNWRPTEAEKRLADPEVLAHLRDLEGLGEEDLPERIRPVFRRMGEEPAPEVRERRRITEENLVKVWERGITVTLGTDAGNIGTLHGPSVFREMEIMVHAGLTPGEVLRCATTNGAKAMGLEREIGRIAKGYAADLVVLNSNPLEGIEKASDASHVIRAGRVFEVEGLLARRSPHTR